MSNRTLMLMTGVVAALMVALGAVFVIAATGGDEDGPSAGALCQDNSLIVLGDAPATVLDPIQVVDVTTSAYIVEIFGGLVTLAPDLSVQGDIAESWQRSDDGRSYTFTLRDNVVFHSGNQRRVTAEDVKYSLERAAGPENASPTVLAYLGNIAGLRDRYEGRADSVTGITVVDERTLRIDLVAPSDFFLSELTYPVAYVVDKAQIESEPDGWTRIPNGTGPFRLAEHRPGDRLRLVKNPRYHLGPPALDEVTFELGGGPALTRYQNDEIHISPVPASLLDSIRDGSNALSKEYRAVPDMSVFYFTLNTSEPPFDDPKVRQALASAVDFSNINEVLLFDGYRVADGFVPPGLPGYDESVHGHGFDPEAARKLLSESKYAGNMPRIVLSYSGSGATPSDLLVAIQDAWQQNLGVTVELQAVDSSAFLREQRRGNFQMQSDGWSADYPDPEDFIGKLFSSQSPLNFTGYKNTDVDALIARARTSQDREERYALYAQAEQLVLDDAAVIPTFWPVSHFVVKPCVKGLPDAPMTIPRYRYIEIKED